MMRNEWAHPSASSITERPFVVVTAFLGVLLGFPTLAFYSIGVVAPAMSKELHWSFGVILGGLGVMTGVLVISSPLVGAVADRYGARRIVLPSALAFPLAFMSFALTGRSVALYYGQWLLMSLAGAGLTPLVWARLLALNIDRHRGLAFGVALTGTGIFITAGKPILAAIDGRWGWRAAFLIMGAASLVILLPAVLLWFSEPRRTEPQYASSAKPLTGGAYAAASATEIRWRFGLLAASFLLLAFGGTAPLPNLENILAWNRVSPASLGALTGLLGVATIAGRILSGWLLDRFWAPGVAACFLLPGAVSCWWLATGEIGWREAQLSMAFLGASVSAELDLLGYLTARYLGLPRFGQFYGSLFAIFSVGAGIGPALLGHLFDVNHGYGAALRLCGCSFVLATALLLSLGRYPVEVR